jgi:acetoacetyl-CoA synthetase
MKNILWRPTQPEKTKMAKLISHVNNNYGTKLSSYDDLHAWSINYTSEFWSEIWDCCSIKYSKPYTNVIDDKTKMPGAKWFSGARLNYSENLLRFQDEHPAIYFKSEEKPLQIITYGILYNEVERLAHSLREIGVEKGDRVVGFIPNIPEAVIAMLATASIGAVWSSASPDFGTKGVLDRFSQIKPKVIFSSDGYNYNGNSYDCIEKLSEILKGLPSVQKAIVIEYTNESPDLSNIINGVLYHKFISNSPAPLQFEQLPFDHPLYIMYSSGTTGLPKSIVHSAGGTLIQHLKELNFHCNLERKDCLFYFTTSGWMMWNWLISSLSIGSSLVLYDGSPFYPNGNSLWKMAEELGITIFGTSPKYLDACKENRIFPKNIADLSKLHTILSTGSPLVDESFDYVYENIKKDVLLGSISGGTDIISCFAIANPMLPVKRGELQCKGLGMDVKAYDKAGQSIIDQKGELVCTTAFPSMPIYFWNDLGGKKYHDAYFKTFPNIWHHSDFIEISENGGIKIFGRSDTTLNPGGVRIGTAEIYRVLNSMKDIDDSLVIGQDWKGDQRIILFIIMREGQALDKNMVNKIKKMIRSNCSPRHVPNKVIQIKGIPYTINGKKVEVAVKKVIQGEAVNNRDSLTDPSVLDLYKNISELET